jgi:gamma-glutamyltranspeptidase
MTAHVNVIAPRKRTYHTLAPAMALQRRWLAVHGARHAGQRRPDADAAAGVQQHRAVRHDAAAGVEAPRWRLHANGRLQIEEVRAYAAARTQDGVSPPTWAARRSYS